jgi:hypothetical protein
LKVGDIITIYIWQSKTGQMVGRLNKIILADGTLMRDTQTGADNGGRADTDVGRQECLEHAVPKIEEVPNEA